MTHSLWSFGDLFEGRLFVVPDYQRGYAWEEPHLQDFLDDLEILSDGQFHYTGTVVLHEQTHIEEDTRGRRHRVHNVVDGQQRLTTTLILLDAIRRELDELGTEADHNLRDGIQERFLWFDQRQTGAPIYKLQLHGDLGEFFQKRILSDSSSIDGPRTQPERRLEAAKQHFAEYLAQQHENRGESYRSWLEELHSKVTNQLKTTLYPVEQEAEVGVIFEVMNNRGKPLSELEKVKNYLLYVASKLDDSGGLGREINGTWGRLLQFLMAAGLARSSDEDQLLKTHWLMVYDPDERHWKASRSIKERFDVRKSQADGGVQQLCQDIRGYLETLAEVALAFRDAERPERTGAFAGLSPDPNQRAELALWSERLRRIGIVAPFRPLLAAARIDTRANAAHYLEVLKACESFSYVVYRIAGCRPHAARSRFYRLAHDLFSRRVDVDAAVERIHQWIPEYCSYGAYERFFELDAKDPRDFYTWPGIRYLLYEWEMACAGGKQVKLSWKELHARQPKSTIEHVLPQTPDDPYWTERFDEAAIGQCMHDLGNLNLTEDNSSYSNKSYPRKKGELGATYPCYVTANLASERNLARWSDWTPDAVAERRAELVAWAKSRWPHPEPTPKRVLSDHDELAEEAEAEDLGEDWAAE
jgi:hypothetical protein